MAKKLPDKLTVKLHFDFMSDGKPVLMGVAIEGFGWILGGTASGELILDTTIDIGNGTIHRGNQPLLEKLQIAIRDYDWNKIGGNLPALQGD